MSFRFRELGLLACKCLDCIVRPQQDMDRTEPGCLVQETDVARLEIVETTGNGNITHSSCLSLLLDSHTDAETAGYVFFGHHVDIPAAAPRVHGAGIAGLVVLQQSAEIDFDDLFNKYHPVVVLLAPVVLDNFDRETIVPYRLKNVDAAGFH